MVVRGSAAQRTQGSVVDAQGLGKKPAGKKHVELLLHCCERRLIWDETFRMEFGGLQGGLDEYSVCQGPRRFHVPYAQLSRMH